jgi:eukaryotic-like serine/threonine-protein kinase
MSGDDDAPEESIAFDKTVLSDVPTARSSPVSPHDAVTVPRIAGNFGAPVPVGGQITLASPEEAAQIAGIDRAAGATMPSGDTPRAASPGEMLFGQVLGGRYELVRLLGQGGMGKVFKGIHLGLGIPVAVKIMHPMVAASPDYARRFRREAHAASILSHPNAVRVLDFGEDKGTLYLVMEYLEGHSLTAWLAGLYGPPLLAEVVPIIEMLADVFTVAHGYGIVHRDLKPDNVFLTAAGGKPLVKVVDFGLAHVDDARDKGPTLTSKDVIAGTPEYMSPEQCRSLAVGPSADIYAIGCVLTELLQLRPPFRGDSAIEVLAKQMFAQPPPLNRPPGSEPVPPLLERLRLDLLAKSPDKRPQSAAEVKARLHEAMSAEATLARLPTRKGDEPLGDRQSRAPQWQASANASAQASEPAPQTLRTRERTVGLLRLGQETGGVGEECQTGLASHKLETVVVRGAAEAAAQKLTVVVLDAGSRVDQAAGVLAELGKGGARTLVCAADLTTERMNALVAAGAADVLRYPVSADALARKLERMIRRGR